MVPGGGDRRHRSALLASNLYLEAPDRTACTGYQDPLAGELAAMAQGPQRRRARDRQRGGGSKAYALWQDGKAVGRNDDTLSPAGLVNQGRNARAGGRTGAVGRRALDDSNDVLPGYEAVRADGEQAPRLSEVAWSETRASFAKGLGS